jgi:undecaprenyl-diphosphatase
MKSYAVFYWIFGILIAAVAIALSFHFDEAVRQWMHQHQNSSTRAFMENVSRFGDWPEHMLAGVGFIAFAQWTGRKNWTRIIIAMLIALSVAGVTGRVLKISTGRARPSVKAEQMWNGARLSGSKYQSFPSGHVDASVGFFAVLLLARRRIGIACLPIPILIAFSRLYLGAHWLSDVVCAAVLGILAAVLATHFFLRRATEMRSDAELQN